MHSLVFLCARQVIQDQVFACQALAFLPQELYAVLFKAAFLDRKTLVLQKLVQMWPFPLLSFHQLLRENSDCRRIPLQERPTKESVQAVILGLSARLREPPPRRKLQLQLLDMTGILDSGYEEDLTTMTMWSRTVSVIQTCIMGQLNKSLRQRRRRAKRRKAVPPIYTPTPIEVRVDLRVTHSSYGFLKDTLQTSAFSPLRLCCRDFRAEELPLNSTVDMLELLDPMHLRRVDLCFNSLELSGLCELMASIVKFNNLLSLKLQYSYVDLWQLSSEAEESFRLFITELNKLNRLRELNLGSSCLSGRLGQLLSALQDPLESLEVAFCYLLPTDLRYLAQSPHGPHLKKLDLSGNNLSGALLGPFQSVLKAVCVSLTLLNVTECELMDTHLLSTLPSLCRCVHLRYLGLYGNPLSTSGLKTLLVRSEVLSELQLVVYPFPVDCYEILPWPPPAAILLDEEKFAHVQAELRQMLLSADRTNVLWTTDVYGPNMPDYFSL
ncbi:leucine-rich repeat-containing protein 14-like [Antechinus flavipes]|uniref:leucine-rich repeat-containing protein 14-like n=1 Tax=Antechinus flavipes TaxID=38775 RepID=UPI00223575EA|nr:leucine-rich repeat-containing protein 14-like [Antechinus flavipes]XP_051827217.1 leucine-rich repeat-containing protein 14-like [Antechinus flavipes]